MADELELDVARAHETAGREGQRVAVVTGGTRGIGAAIVSRLRAEGWRVLVIARHLPDAALSTAQAEQDAATYIGADLSSEEGVETALQGVRKCTARLDLLVNNAGAIGDVEEFHHISYSDFDRSLRLNSMAGFFLARGLQPLLCKGWLSSVINIGSVYGDIPDADVVGYGIAKSTIPLLTEVLARALGAAIRVNSILPGHIDTPMTQAAPVSFLETIQDKTVMKRIGKPHEIAGIVMFLASQEASFLTGSTLRADGGFIAGR